MAATDAHISVSDLLLDPGEFDESLSQLASLATALEAEQHINSHLQGQAELHSTCEQWQAKAAASDQQVAAMSVKLQEALTQVATLQQAEAGWHAERDDLQQQVSASAAQLDALHEVVFGTQQHCIELAAGGGVTPAWALGVRGSVIEELRAQSEALLTLQQADWQHNAQLAELRASLRALQARSQAEHDARSSIVPVDHTPLIAELRGALDEHQQSAAAAGLELQAANAELSRLQQELECVKSADALQLDSLRAEAAAASQTWELERQQLQQASAESQVLVQELQSQLQLSAARVAELEHNSAAVQAAQRDTELHAEAQQEAMSHLAEELAQAQTALADAAQAQAGLSAESAAAAAAALAQQQQAAEQMVQLEASIAQLRNRLDDAAAEWGEQQQQLEEELQAAQTAAASAATELTNVRSVLQRAEEELQAEADAGAALEAANQASTAELAELRQEMQQFETLKAEHTELVQAAELLQQQVQHCEGQLSAERTARAAADGALASLREASGSQESTAAAAWAAERTSLQSQLSAAVAAADTLAVRLAEAEEGSEEAENELEQQQQQVQSVTTELNAANTAHEQLKEEHAAVVAQLEAAAATVDQYKHELSDAQAKALQLEADIASRYVLYTHNL
jgi:chromosome segregation ATPase